jgi:hypothetical protein
VLTTRHLLSSKLALTSLTSVGRSIGIVCSRPETTGFSFIYTHVAYFNIFPPFLCCTLHSGRRFLFLVIIWHVSCSISANTSATLTEPDGSSLHFLQQIPTQRITIDRDTFLHIFSTECSVTILFFDVLWSLTAS